MQESRMYCIKVSGGLTQHWVEWFSGFTISCSDTQNGKKINEMTGEIRDQSEMLGIIRRLSELNLDIISINKIFNPKEELNEKSKNPHTP